MKIFRADAMQSTPFVRADAARQLGVVFVDRPEAADIIVACRASSLKGLDVFDAKLAVWTHEPRFNDYTSSPTFDEGIRKPIFVMNAYTGRVFTNTVSFFFPRVKPDFDQCLARHRDKPNRAVLLATYRSERNSVIHGSLDSDLNIKRQQLAIRLQSRGFCDIFGRKWPSSYQVLGESRGAEWHDIKLELLAGYSFNIAYENTLIPYYTTEKIWDAILGASLPVYHANKGIYDVLPKDSFVDGAGKTTEEIADEIMAMTPATRIDRYATCLKAFCTAAASGAPEDARRGLVRRTRDFLHEVLESSHDHCLPSS